MTDLRTDYAALEGREVTPDHIQWCLDFAHGSFRKGGVDQTWCPRCGAVRGKKSDTTWGLLRNEEVIWRGQVARFEMGRPGGPLIRLADGHVVQVRTEELQEISSLEVY